MNADFLDVLRALLAADARFLVVGAHAMAAHGVPRATGDLDIWVQPTADNAHRVWNALIAFGAPLTSLDFSKSDLTEPEVVWQLGLPPQRIDILTSLTGVEFRDAWVNRQVHRIDTLEVPFIGKAALLANKQATGRTKDLVDIEILERRDLPTPEPDSGGGGRSGGSSP